MADRAVIFWLVVCALVFLAGGLWAGRRVSGRELDEAFNEGWEAGHHDGLADGLTETDVRAEAIEPTAVLPRLGGSIGLSMAADWREQGRLPTAAERDAMLNDLAPAVLEAENVPEPGDIGDQLALGRAAEDERSGLGHLSPYGPNLTAAQRRRDKHKQRGQYAPGQLPDPPADIGAWWAGELACLVAEGQSEWLTRNLAAA